MRIHKKVLSHDSGEWILCAWDECERQGYELHKAIVHEGTNNIHYVFCSERHKMFWVNSHRRYGALPVGMRHLI